MDDCVVPDQIRYCEALRYVEDSTLNRLCLGKDFVSFAAGE